MMQNSFKGQNWKFFVLQKWLFDLKYVQKTSNTLNLPEDMNNKAVAWIELIIGKTGVINDPLGQTHSLASNEHCFHFVLFC